MGDLDLTIFDSLDISDHCQPAPMPQISDDSVDNQILVAGFFDFSGPVLPSIDGSADGHLTSIDEDFDTSGLFPPDFDFMAQHFDEYEIQAAELLACNEEAPHQSTIDEQMTRMELNPSHSYASSPCLPSHVTPLRAEQGEIDNSIRSTDVVRRHQRLSKKAPCSKRNSPDHHASSTVAPINIPQSQGGSDESGLVQMQSQLTHPQQLVGLSDEASSDKIRIISSPRERFRPRTANECTIASHFIRCPETEPHQYPTIAIPPYWENNWIEVCLVAIDGQLHEYTIHNKHCDAKVDAQDTICRGPDPKPQTLYYRVTADDCKKGFKEILAEYVKSKQDAVITKELIQRRKLDQSMLRFTRFCPIGNDSCERDLKSTAYSCVMTEVYCDVSVEKIGPSYGPMTGDTVYVVVKGRVSKDELAIEVIENQTGHRQQVPYTKNGNSVYFTMPNVAHSQQPRLIVTICILYKGEELHQSAYCYESSLDRMFATLNIADAPSTASSLPTSSAFNIGDYALVTGARPTALSSRRTPTTKTAKRLTPARRVK